jgi:predicted alpha/beta-fold hydrolase
MEATSSFVAPWWLRNRHCQTLWPVLFRRRRFRATTHERLELPDGDFLDLAWTKPAKGPVVLVVHGLQGSFDSHYVRGLLSTIESLAWQGVLMHFRGCSGTINRLARSYHSGDTADLAYVVNLLRQRNPATPIFAVGFSLGANVLLKWLGETGINNEIKAAAAVSVPFRLDLAVDNLRHGFARLYQWYLLRSLLRTTRAKFARRSDSPCRREQLSHITTLRQFDDCVTAPLHGFTDAADYYRQSSCADFIARIRVPTLIVHAADDPFLPASAIPPRDIASPLVQMAISRHGGHVGFVGGSVPWRPCYYVDKRIPTFFSEFVNSPAPALRSG